METGQCLEQAGPVLPRGGEVLVSAPLGAPCALRGDREGCMGDTVTGVG